MEIIVRESGKGKFAQEIIIDDHILMADEPTVKGGNDLGPSPYDFLLAALGACTSMTLRLYADRKKIPLESVVVKLKYEKNHVEDCENCEHENARADHIERNIILKGELSEAQRTLLLKIANMCPVHRTLTSSVMIETKLA